MATMLVERDAPSAVTETVRRAQAGDVAAFERLYRENVDRIFALCLPERDGGGPGAARRVRPRLEKLGGFEGKSASPLLQRLAVTWSGERRAEGIRVGKVFGTDDLEAYETPTRPPDPGDALDLERAIATLPPGARTVFVLHDVEGYKHEEIAELHGIAVGTCKAQLHRARRLLREALER